MKCEEVQILIEDYVDNALDRKAIAFVKSHMTDCPACASFHRELNRELEIYAHYERDVEVTPALWTSIESRIKQEQIAPEPGLFLRLREQIKGMFSAPRLSPGFAAAMVVIAIGVTVGVMSYLNSRAGGNIVAVNEPTIPEQPIGPEKPIPPPAAPGSANAGGAVADNGKATNQHTAAPAIKPAVKKDITANAVLTPAQLVRDAEQKYLTAISMLSRDVNRQRSQLDPILLARLDASLSEIDKTIKETRRVVRENPGDPIALQYLLAAYSKKVEVLRGMTTD